MRKFVLLAAALAVTAGAAPVSIACDHDKASSTSTSSSASNGCGNTATGSNAALISSDGSGSCAAHKNAAAGSACSAKNKNSMTSMTAAECKNMKCEDAVFSVADMHGECCVEGVSNALASVKGVHGVRVDYAQHKAYVCTAANKLDRKAVTKSLQKAGFSEVSYVGVD